MKAYPRPREHFDVNLRSVEQQAVGTTVFACAEALGVTINEMFGQTEMNYIVGNSQALWPAKPGSMGRLYPGHRIAVIDEAGNPVAQARPARSPPSPRLDGTADLVFFLEYFENPEGTRKKFSRSAARRRRDDGGWLPVVPGTPTTCSWPGIAFVRRKSRTVSSHPAVANAAVVPSPDDAGQRGKHSSCSPRPYAPSAALRRRSGTCAFLAPYEYPKEIEFIDALPMTTTGKVQRRVLRERELRERPRMTRQRPGMGTVRKLARPTLRCFWRR